MKLHMRAYIKEPSSEYSAPSMKIRKRIYCNERLTLQRTAKRMASRRF
jgi:hypothetical protein